MSMDNARSGWEIKKEVAACQSCYLEHRPAAEQTVVGDALTRAKAKLEDSAAPQLARLNFSVIKLAEAMGRLSPGGTV
jgi:Zn-finger protein